MAPVTRDENGEGEALRCGHFRRGRRRGGTTVLEADGTAKSARDGW
jgi:hypothetical protein